MELLILQCGQLGKRKKTVRLSTADIRNVRLARDIILEDIRNPPTLPALAIRAGLNEFKLKAGFRQVFANSVFGYLSDHRLELAKQDVLEGYKSLTDIAYETGYASLSHFSHSFKKKFGISPVKMR